MDDDKRQLHKLLIILFPLIHHCAFRNPCGVYHRTFEYRSDSDYPKSYLNFEGVDSCFYLYINGKFAGYSQVSHSTSEFDITDYLSDGINHITVFV